jgi:hypothetical protein
MSHKSNYGKTPKKFEGVGKFNEVRETNGEFHGEVIVDNRGPTKPSVSTSDDTRTDSGSLCKRRKSASGSWRPVLAVSSIPFDAKSDLHIASYRRQSIPGKSFL